jgi:hypothetical protein
VAVDYNDPNGNNDVDDSDTDDVVESSADTTVGEYSDFGTQTEATAPSTPVNTETATGPDAWKDLLAALPDEATRGAIKPFLADWEKGTTQRFQSIHDQYANLKQFQGADPAMLQAGLTLTDQINADPVGFMERMRNALISQGLYKEAQQVQEQISEEEPQEAVDPRITAMEQQQQAFFQSIENQRLQQEEQQRSQYYERQADIQTDNELSALETKYGKLSDPFKAELFNRAIIMGQQRQAAVPLEDAFNNLQNFLASANQARPGNRAPRVFPTSGGTPATRTKAVGDMTSQERRAAAVELVRSMQEDS